MSVTPGRAWRGSVSENRDFTKGNGRIFPLEVIKNAAGKTVCQADDMSKTVVIVHKGQMTMIRFLDDGTMRITNTQIA